MVRRIRSAVGPKTRAVGITWVHSGSGVKLPVRRVADALAEVNAGRAEAERVLLVVDGVHGLGVEDETVARMGCDFFDRNGAPRSPRPRRVLSALTMKARS